MTSIPVGQAVDLERVDLFSPRFHAEGDPHRVWEAMRERAPLHRQTLPDGRSFWSVTRYHDACRVLGAHQEFTSARGSLLMQLGKGDAASGRMLVSTDPPRHSELRRPLNRMFTGRALEAGRGHVREAVQRMLRPALDGGIWDLAEQAMTLPMAVAGLLMDVPEPDWDELTRWTAMAAAPDDPAYRQSSGAATLALAHHQLFEYFSEQHTSRLGTPGNDAVRALMTMSAGGRPLTREEVVVNCYSLLLGANATTPHTVAGTVLALLEHPGRLRAVREDRSLVPALVEEGLRWTSPASSFLRHAVDDVELSGGVVPRGDAVAVWVGAANRDPDAFVEPWRFDVNRSDNRHIAFGLGPHYCLGASVARLTLNVFFEEVLDLIAEFEPAGEPVRLESNFIAGFTSMPVRTVLRSTAHAADI